MEKKITQEEIDSLNKMVKGGQIEITESHFIWGPRAFKTKNNHLKVTCKQGRFYGGGISDNFYTFLIDGRRQLITDDFLVVQKAFFDSL